MLKHNIKLKNVKHNIKLKNVKTQYQNLKC